MTDSSIFNTVKIVPVTVCLWMESQSQRQNSLWLNSSAPNGESTLCYGLLFWQIGEFRIIAVLPILWYFNVKICLHINCNKMLGYHHSYKFAVRFIQLVTISHLFLLEDNQKFCVFRKNTIVLRKSGESVLFKTKRCIGNAKGLTVHQVPVKRVRLQRSTFFASFSRYKGLFTQYVGPKAKKIKRQRSKQECIPVGCVPTTIDRNARGGDLVPGVWYPNAKIPVKRMTDRCKNITLTTTSFAGNKQQTSRQTFGVNGHKVEKK